MYYVLCLPAIPSHELGFVGFYAAATPCINTGLSHVITNLRSLEKCCASQKRQGQGRTWACPGNQSADAMWIDETWNLAVNKINDLNLQSLCLTLKNVWPYQFMPECILNVRCDTIANNLWHVEHFTFKCNIEIFVLHIYWHHSVFSGCEGSVYYLYIFYCWMQHPKLFQTLPNTLM